jgi:hypothetical protein
MPSCVYIGEIFKGIIERSPTAKRSTRSFAGQSFLQQLHGFVAAFALHVGKQD